jgi:hypothetical protein
MGLRNQVQSGCKVPSPVVATIRSAYVRGSLAHWVIVPLAPTFGERSADEQLKVMDSFATNIAKAKKMRMEGTVVIAWRDGRHVRYAAPPTVSQPLPDFSWMELIKNLNRLIYSDDPLILAQLSHARGVGASFPERSQAANAAVG